MKSSAGVDPSSAMNPETCKAIAEILEWWRPAGAASAGSTAVEAIRHLGRAGVLRRCAPGSGSSFFDKMALVELLTSRSAGLAASVLAHLNIPLWLLKNYATSEVCREYYEGSLDGRLVAGTAMSEEGGGSDPMRNTLTKVVINNGSVVINGGRKVYVLNAPEADYVVVICRSQDRTDFLGFTWILVPLAAEGVSVVPSPVNALKPASFGAIEFRNCTLSADHIIGEPHRGFLQLVPAMIEERLTGATVASKLTQDVLDKCIEFVRTRPFAGYTLAHNQAVRHRVAELYADHAVARSYLEWVVHSYGSGKNVSQRQAAGVKLIVGQTAKRVVNSCSQLFGARGFLRDYPLVDAAVNVQAGQLFAGVPEVMKEVVSRNLHFDVDGILGAELHEFRAHTRIAVDTHIAPHIEEFEELGVTRRLFATIGLEGLLKVLVPKELGGLGGSFLHSVVFAEELMRHRVIGVASSLMIQANTLCPLLARFGSAYVRATFLQPLMDGATVGSLGVTEPAGGSALLSSVQCNATSDGDDWVVTGEKVFITNGPIADVVVVLAQTERQPGPFSMTLIVIPTDTEGCSVVKLDMATLNSSPLGRLRFTKCRVPKAHSVGMRGKGFLYVSETMREERLLIAVGSIALAEACLRRTARHLVAPNTTGTALIRHQTIRQELGQLSAELEAARAFGYAAARQVAANESTLTATSIAKFCLCELAQRVILRCVELHGGAGLIEGHWMERVYRDSRVLSVFAGTSETMREIVGRCLMPEAARAHG